MRNLFNRLLVITPILMSQIPAMGDSLKSTGQGLPTGVVDPNFTITSSPTGADVSPGGTTYTIPPVKSPAYAIAPDGTQWIGPNLDNSVQQPIGDYNFQTNFTVDDPANVKITGYVGTDNKLTDIKLNGISQKIAGSSLDSYLSYTIASGFRQGNNTLDFVVNNDSTGGPTGLMVSESTSVPEPSTIAVFGLGALALWCRRKSPGR